MTAVYEQLAAEGYIETVPGAVAKVAAGIATTLKAPVSSRSRAGKAIKLSTYAQLANQFDLQSTPNEPHPRLKINFLYGALAPDDFPKLAWRRAYDRALLKRQVRLYYASAQGEADCR